MDPANGGDDKQIGAELCLSVDGVRYRLQQDGSRMVSRLAANIPLIRRNLCPLSFVDVRERAYISACWPSAN